MLVCAPRWTAGVVKRSKARKGGPVHGAVGCGPTGSGLAQLCVGLCVGKIAPNPCYLLAR